MNLVEQVTGQLRSEIEQGILQAKADGRFDFADMPAFVVEVPKDKTHGDFATNAAMMLTKQAKMKPRDIAQAIVDSLNKDSKLIEKVEIAGPGFINFYLSNNWMYDILPQVESMDEKYGFVPNLSILDLLFNLGPEARGYLMRNLNGYKETL